MRKIILVILLLIMFNSTATGIDMKEVSSRLGFDMKEVYNRLVEKSSKEIQSNPDNIIAYKMRGISYFELGQYDKAFEDFNKAIQLGLNDVAIYINRGIIHVKKGQYDKAIEDFNKAIQLDPNLSAAYNNRGIAYAKKGQYDKAIEDLNKACSMGESNACSILAENQKASTGSINNYRKTTKDKLLRLINESRDFAFNLSLDKCLLEGNPVPYCKGYLFEMLKQQYPGSAFDIVSRSGVIVVGNEQFTFHNGNLVKHTVQDVLLYEVFINNNMARVKVSDGSQYISFVVNLNAEASKETVYINDVSLTISAKTEEMLMKNNRGVAISKNELIKIINDAVDNFRFLDKEDADLFVFANTLLLRQDFVRDILASYIKQQQQQQKQTEQQQQQQQVQQQQAEQQQQQQQQVRQQEKVEQQQQQQKVEQKAKQKKQRGAK